MMAEAAGLAVGVIALTGLFNNAVDCFELIQLGRNFGKSFQTSQLKLDNARLRLSRWGESLDLSNNTASAQSLKDKFGSDQTIDQAKTLLNQILELFADAEGISMKYKSRTKAGDPSLLPYDPSTDLEPAMAQLHLTIRQLSVDRQNKSGLKEKVKWAMYEEKHFRRLIEDITGLVNDLVELFPSAKEKQYSLCADEVSAVKNNKELSVLKEIATEQDRVLADTLAAASGDAAKSHNIVFSGSNNSGFQLGHNSGSISGFIFGKGN
ncbi:MAG: hypothetical protein M1822_009062 [Bathelium mastoideum]|nr:MAG: hypothetical protein M1822_009062 [Bathelium mastoideum]